MENASNFGQKVITDKIIVSSSDDLNLSMANLKRKIDLVTGQKKVDLLVKNASIINVFSGEIHEDNVAIADGIFVGFGHTEEYNDYDAQDIIDAQGRLCPFLHMMSWEILSDANLRHLAMVVIQYLLITTSNLWDLEYVSLSSSI